MTAGENVAIGLNYSSVLRELTRVILQPAEHLADDRGIGRSWPQRQVADILYAHLEVVVVASVEMPSLVGQTQPDEVLGVPECSCP